MTPAELTEIEKRIEDGFRLRDDLRALIAEVRCGWKEREMLVQQLGAYKGAIQRGAYHARAASAQ